MTAFRSVWGLAEVRKASSSLRDMLLWISAEVVNVEAPAEIEVDSRGMMTQVSKPRRSE